MERQQGQKKGLPLRLSLATARALNRHMEVCLTQWQDAVNWGAKIGLCKLAHVWARRWFRGCAQFLELDRVVRTFHAQLELEELIRGCYHCALEASGFIRMVMHGTLDYFSNIKHSLPPFYPTDESLLGVLHLNSLKSTSITVRSTLLRHGVPSFDISTCTPFVSLDFPVAAPTFEAARKALDEATHRTSSESGFRLEARLVKSALKTIKHPAPSLAVPISIGSQRYPSWRHVIHSLFSGKVTMNELYHLAGASFRPFGTKYLELNPTAYYSELVDWAVIDVVDGFFPVMHSSNHSFPSTSVSC